MSKFAHVGYSTSERGCGLGLGYVDHTIISTQTLFQTEQFVAAI